MAVKNAKQHSFYMEGRGMTFEECRTETIRLARAEISDRLVELGASCAAVDPSNVQGSMAKAMLRRVVDLNFRGWDSGHALSDTAQCARPWLGDKAVRSPQFEELVDATYMLVEDMKGYGVRQSDVCDVMHFAVEDALPRGHKYLGLALRRVGVDEAPDSPFV